MLKELISYDAEFILQLLSEKGYLTIDEIEKLTGYREMYIHSALGWLSAESKINYRERDDILYVELNK